MTGTRIAATITNAPQPRVTRRRSTYVRNPEKFSGEEMPA